MTNTVVRRAAAGLAAIAGLLLPSCGSGVGNAAPSFLVIPNQSTPSGQALNLDLAPFATDREGQTLAFSVVSGGGSMAGSTYSHTFDTLGSYQVTVRVTDPEGKSDTATFTVVVPTAANLAVVREGDDIMLLDGDTQKSLAVASATGFADAFKAVLGKGHVVYERSVGSTTRLFVYDPNTRATATLGDSADFGTTHAAKTPDDRVVFVKTHSASDTDLFVWEAATGLTRTISAGSGEHDRNPLVNSAGLVFYERGSGGQADVFRYDPATDTSTAVSTSTQNEVLQGVLPDGGVVFSRVGGGGELDLFYFRVGAGLVEIGSDLSSTVQSQTKTYRGVTADNKVAFEVTASTNQDLYVWDAATGTSRAVATTAVDETFAAVTPANEIVYVVAASGSNDDLRIYTWSSATDRAISTDAANDVFEGVLSNGDVVFLRETGTGDDLFFFDTSAGTTGALATAGSDDYVFGKVLSNDKVAYTLLGGSGGVFIIDPSDLSTDTVAGPASVFQGETSGGDVVAQTDVGGQKDLVLWDESAGATVTISSTAGDDAFGAGLANGKILFTRVVAGQSTSELFVWDPATSQETQLTTGTSVDHTVVTTFAADNS